jgi:hypothetical protein
MTDPRVSIGTRDAQITLTWARTELMKKREMRDWPGDTQAAAKEFPDAVR